MYVQTQTHTHIFTHAPGFLPKRCTLIHFRENHHRTICFDIMALGYLPPLPSSPRLLDRPNRINLIHIHGTNEFAGGKSRIEREGGGGRRHASERAEEREREKGKGKREAAGGRSRRVEGAVDEHLPKRAGGFSPASVSLLATLWLNYLQSTSNIFKLNFMYVESCIFPLFLLYRIALRTTTNPPPSAHGHQPLFLSYITDIRTDDEPSVSTIVIV